MNPTRPLAFENFVLDIARRELKRGHELVALEPQVFDLLVYVIRNREQVVSKDDLVKAVWGGRIVSDSTLTTRINAMRKALGDSGEEQRLIRTVARKGIRFVGAVTEGEVVVASAAAPDTSPPLPLPDKPSIAVLPFQNMSGDPEQEYFCDGMVEEIITALSRFQRLFVIARNSTFTYKGRAVDVKQVGRDLGVRYVLEGSVRRAGQHVRITGQLIDAVTGIHLWADKFDGELADIFDLQDRVALTVVGIIEPRILAAEIGRAERKPLENLDAYDLYLRALGLVDTPNRTRHGHATALSLLYRAIELSPKYALALARASMIFVGMYAQGWSENFESDPLESIRLARAAIEADLDNTDVAYIAGFSLIFFATDQARALQLMDRSLEVNGNCARAWLFSGAARIYLGDHERAIEYLLRGQRMDPFDPLRYWTRTYLSFVYAFCGRHEESLALAQQAVNDSPKNASGLRLLAAANAALGNIEDARRAVQASLEVDHLYVMRKRIGGKRYSFYQNPAYAVYLENLRKAGMPD